MTDTGESANAERWWAWSFAALIVLALVWPLPVAIAAHATVGALTDLHADSFLGHEAPRWDVAFWAIAGLWALALVVPRFAAIRETSEQWIEIVREAPSRVWSRWRSLRWLDAILLALGGALVVAAMALLADERVAILVESIDMRPFYAPFRYANRLGGGQNPWLIVVFFLVAGIALARRRWVSIGIAMAMSGTVGGLLVQIVKQVVRRARPEMWLGAFSETVGSQASFPSGHTMAAFAVGGVLVFGAEKRPVRVVALLVALLIAAARVVSFRHWLSDVAASALIGAALAWFFTRALVGDSSTAG